MIEDVGYLVKCLFGIKIGVFIGMGNIGYSFFLLKVNLVIEGLVVVNISFLVGLNWVSYILNLYGLSELIDIVCFSLLVVIYYVIFLIEEGICDMVLVGGVNIIILFEVYISFDKVGVLSKEGKCKMFLN